MKSKISKALMAVCLSVGLFGIANVSDAYRGYYGYYYGHSYYNGYGYHGYGYRGYGYRGYGCRSCYRPVCHRPVCYRPVVYYRSCMPRCGGGCGYGFFNRLFW